MKMSGAKPKKPLAEHKTFKKLSFCLLVKDATCSHGDQAKNLKEIRWK